MAIDINIPIENAVTNGSLNPVTSNAVFDALAALPSTSGFVPYTGATNDVDLGVHDLTATQGTFATSGNPDTLTVNHSSGSGKALTITKGGNGEGVYVNKTGGSGNAVTVIGDLEATNLKRTGGTSSQFLKANGSVDSTSYQPTLVSGTSIKTINSTTLLGSGNITVIPTHDGATYDTNAIQTLTAAEYAAITPNASTLYFIV
jgi:hemin uptake protein HemP